MVYFTPITSHDDAKHHHDAFVAAKHDPRMMPFSYTHEGQQHHFAIYNRNNAPKDLSSHMVDGQHFHQITTDKQYLPNLPANHAIPQPAVAALKAHLQNHQQWFRSATNNLHTFIVPTPSAYGSCSQALVLAERLTNHRADIFVSVIVAFAYVDQVHAKFYSLSSNQRVHIHWWEPRSQLEAYTLIQKVYPKQWFNVVVDFQLPGQQLGRLAVKYFWMSSMSIAATNTFNIGSERSKYNAAVLNRPENVPSVSPGVYLVNPLISADPASLSKEQKQKQSELALYLVGKQSKSVILVTLGTVMPSVAQEKLKQLVFKVLKTHHVIVATIGRDSVFADRQPSMYQKDFHLVGYPDLPSLVRRYENLIGLVIQDADFSTALEIAAASSVPSLYLPSVVGSIYDAETFQTLGYGFSCVNLPHAAHASDPDKIDSKDILDHHEHEGDAAWDRVENKFRKLVETRVPNAKLYFELCKDVDFGHQQLKQLMATRDDGLEQLCKLLEQKPS